MLYLIGRLRNAESTVGPTAKPVEARLSVTSQQYMLS
jgi:hypothetical protein